MEKVKKDERHYSIISILSFIFGCLGVLLEKSLSKVFWEFAMILPFFAIVFGFIGINKIKEDKELIGSVFAVFGIFLGCVEIFSLLISNLLKEFIRFLRY